MWSLAISFLSVLWWRGVSKLICYRLTGEFWITRQRDFDSLHSLLKKLKQKLSFLFVGKGKLFIMKLFFEEFNLIFFTAESAWPVLKCNQGNFEVHFFIFYSMVKEITLLKGNLCIYECLIDI